MYVLKCNRIVRYSSNSINAIAAQLCKSIKVSRIPSSFTKFTPLNNYNGRFKCAKV